MLQNISFKYSIDKHSKLQSLILVCIAASLLTVSASIPGHEYEPLLWQHMQKKEWVQIADKTTGKMSYSCETEEAASLFMLTMP